MGNYFFINENPSIAMLKEAMNVVFGILVFLLILKLFYFLISYILKTFWSAIVALFSIFTNNCSSGNNKTRTTLYREDGLNKKDKNILNQNKMKKPTNINPPKNLLPKEYEGLSNEEILKKLNQKY